MVSLQKLLVVTPANSIQPSVISQSSKLAKKHQSRVTFFSVAEEIPKEQLALITLLPPQEIMENLVKKQHVILQKAIEQFNHHFDSVDAKNVIGVPFIEVTKKVRQENYDLVILAAKASEHSCKRFFGSTTVHLMRKCPCPVLTIGTKEDKPIKRIVAAIDVYAPSEEGLALNNKILTWAANLAASEKAELHVIHAWELPSEAYLKSWGHNSEVDRLEMIIKEQMDRQKLFDKILKNSFLGENSPITKLIEGIAQEEIPRYIEEQDIDLIVMGTVCRTGIAGLFIGNTAESILGEVSCSVLTLKPDGFETPVK
jgi:universal stress protein E